MPSDDLDGFEEWWDSTGVHLQHQRFQIGLLREAWQAATARERERAARVADNHCQYLTRRCCPSKEDPCLACDIAAAIRGSGVEKEPRDAE